MPGTRTKFNPKRKFAKAPDAGSLGRLETAVRYGGKPDHKRNPGNFGLTPPAMPRDHKSLCDNAGIFHRAEALRLLQLGVRRGMISPWNGTGFPKNIWSMTEGGIPLEAELENPGNGTYHCYPLEENDDFRECVIARWNQTHG